MTSPALRTGFRLALKSTCRPTVTGLENVPTEGGFIVASNHLSFLDSVIIQATMPRMVHFFAKAEYFTQSGVKGWVMKEFFESVGSIPVQRGEQAASVAALDRLVELVEDGQGWASIPRARAAATAVSTADARAWAGWRWPPASRWFRWG